jgi:hypothetical protein
LFPHAKDLKDREFYLHEGADRAKKEVGGSLGCIEILDGKWNHFLGEVEALAKDTCPNIGKASKLRVTIQAAPLPLAKLAS